MHREKRYASRGVLDATLKIDRTTTTRDRASRLISHSSPARLVPLTRALVPRKGTDAPRRRDDKLGVAGTETGLAHSHQIRGKYETDYVLVAGR